MFVSQVLNQVPTLVSQGGTRRGTVTKHDQHISAQVRDPELLRGLLQKVPDRFFEHCKLADTVKQRTKSAGLLSQPAMQLRGDRATIREI